MNRSQQTAEQLAVLQHPAAHGQVAAPPRVVPQKDPQADVGTMITEMEVWFAQLKRTAAAYNSLYQSLLSAQNQTPEGERKKGLPVFEFSAALEGRESREPVKCVVDLKKINPAHVAHVLIPMINSQAGDLSEAVEEIAARVDVLRPLLAAITGVQPQTQAA